MTKKYDVAIVACIMDMTHAGHIELLKLMRKMAKETWLFLHDDKSAYLLKNKFPVQSFEHRRKNLMSIGLVDSVIKVYDVDPGGYFEFELKNSPEKSFVYVLGDDTEEWPGKKVIEKYKVPIIYKKYTEGVSSTKLRGKLNK